LQNPVVPQLGAPWLAQMPAGSEPPLGTGEQAPRPPTRAHDRQVPVQAVAQQTPCAQIPLWQSVPSWQTAPLGLRPHEPAALQYWPGAQSPSFVQVDSQALRPQMKGKQALGAGVLQVPAPSHVPPAVKVPPGSGQLALVQAVPDWYFWQAPAWHLPSVPHDAAPWSTHTAAGSGWPVGTGAQRPIEPASAQEKQAPVQLVAQQTPSAHCPDWHSLPVEQNAPFGLGPHEPCTQTLPLEQLASLPQAV